VSEPQSAAQPTTSRVLHTTLGSLDCVDVGAGPPVLLLHGLHMDGGLWDDVVADLSRDHRCVVPTLPLGAHRRPVPEGADLSVVAVAGLVDEVVAQLGLEDVTAVGNDTGGALLQLALRTPSPRLSRVVLVACEAFDNFPPGLPGRASRLSARLPGGLFLAAQAMRWAWAARLPFTWGWMTRRGLPDPLRRAWFEPLRRSAAVRRDTRRVISSVRPELLVAAADWLPRFPGEVHVVWAAEDRVMPREHYARLLELVPTARGSIVEDSMTLVPLDRPAELAAIVRSAVRRPGRGRAGRG
jgi:pimeloyl-ACP methyl ester carboxylesterase